MKKTIAILLVAILAVSSVFAGFSGKASVGFGGNLDNGNFGFIDQSAKVQFDIDLATATAEQIADGDVYASIKATFGLKLLTGEKSYAGDNPYFGLSSTSANGLLGDGTGAIVATAEIEEAKVAGENWYVSILGMPDGPDYAKSAIDTYTVEDKKDDYGLPMEDFTGNYSFAVPYADTNGIEVGLFGYKFGFGLLGDYTDSKEWKLKDNLNFAVFAETPEYDFNGLTVQAAATYSYKSFDRIDNVVVRPTIGNIYGPDASAYVFSKTNAIGVAAKVGFANDTLSASLATDMGFNLEGEKFEDVFDMDVAANFNWNFLTLDAYYATTAKSGEGTVKKAVWYDEGKYNNNPNSLAGYYVVDDWGNKSKEDVLSFQTKFDLNAMDVPVAITASVKDVLHTVELGVKAEVTAVENLTITASAGYVVDTVDAYDKTDWLAGDGKDLNTTDKNFDKDYKDVFLGQWKVGLDAEYDFGFAKVAAGISAKNAGFKSAVADPISEDVEKEATKKTSVKDYWNYKANQVVLGMSASVSTESIIPGAELKLAWENGDDLLKVYQYDGDDYYNLGKITASCSISF